MLALKYFLWYMDRKKNNLTCLIIWAILGRIYKECYLIFMYLADTIQHPVFICLVRLSYGKHEWSNIDPNDIDPNDINIIAKYIYNSYGLDMSSFTSSEVLHLHQLLNTPNICLRTLVSSFPVIEQHVRHVCIQAVYLWKLSHLEFNIPDPISWGWKWSSVSTFSFIPLWQPCTLPDVCSVLKTCSSTKGSFDNCSCKKRNERYEVLQMWRFNMQTGFVSSA